MFTLIVCEYLRTFPNFESLCDLQSRENILLLNCIFLPKDLITFRTCKIRQERFLFFLNKIFLQTFLIAFFATLGSIFSLYWHKSFNCFGCFKCFREANLKLIKYFELFIYITSSIILNRNGLSHPFLISVLMVEHNQPS